MRRHAAAALAALFALTCALATNVRATSAANGVVGRWSMTSRADDASRVQLTFEYSSSEGGYSHSTWSNGVALADAGIPAERLRGPIGPVTFAIQREPGTFSCTGSAGEGSGAGQFTYAPNPRFDDALASRGLGRPAYLDSLRLAVANASLAFIDRLRATSGHVSISEVARALDHGVTPRYVDEVAAAGYRVSVDQLVRMRDHGVNVDLIRAVQGAGYGSPSPDDLVRLADHGVNERYLREMRAAGYVHASAEQLVTMRDHGVTTRFVADMAANGYKNLSPEELIALRDHGVTASFVERLRAHGYANVPVRDLIRLRDAGI